MSTEKINDFINHVVEISKISNEVVSTGVFGKEKDNPPLLNRVAEFVSIFRDNESNDNIRDKMNSLDINNEDDLKIMSVIYVFSIRYFTNIANENIFDINNERVENMEVGLRLAYNLFKNINTIMGITWR